MPELTPNRYRVFNAKLRNSKNLEKVLGILKRAYPKHSVQLLQDLAADVAMEALQKEEPERTEILGNEIDKLQYDLGKHTWEILGLFPLYNLEWRGTDHDLEFEYPLILDKANIFHDSFDSDILAKDLGIRRNVENWGSLRYSVPKSTNEYSVLLNTSEARTLAWCLVLSLRLWKHGDIGTDVVGCRLNVKSTFPEILVPMDTYPPDEYRPDPYIVDDENAPSILAFCDQFHRLWAKIAPDNVLRIATQNFMKAYQRTPVDRTEAYSRVLGGIFLSRYEKTEHLSKRTAVFLGQNREERVWVDEIVTRAYDLRSEETHANISPEDAEDFALGSNEFLEQYCREAIYFQMCFALEGKPGFLKNLSLDKSPSDVKNLRLKIQNSFWQRAKVLARSSSGERLSLRLWVWD